MDGFSRAKMVEAEAMARLRPFLEEHHNHYVVTGKGPLARFVQEVIGDLVFNDDDGRFWSVELKAERKHTGNLFLESWSNRNLDNRNDHADRGSNPGWLQKQRADLLFYYFLDNDHLYIIDFFKLKRWAFGHKDNPGKLYQYKERCQGRYQQKNDTWGRCVPVDVIRRDVGLRLVFPRQIELWPDEDAA